LIENDVDLLTKFDTPLDGVSSILYKDIQKSAYVDWIVNLRPWKSMVTFTFDDKKHLYDVSAEQAKKYFYDFVRVLNIGVFGKKYVRHCHHSYFGYCLGLEYQKRGVAHLHALVDNYFNYELSHTWWGKYHGFLWITPATDKKKAVDYVCKYVLKSGNGNLEIYIPQKKTVPMYKPDWWIKAESMAADPLQAACEAIDAASKERLRDNLG
jgi:hypothetical protein